MLATNQCTRCGRPYRLHATPCDPDPDELAADAAYERLLDAQADAAWRAQVRDRYYHYVHGHSRRAELSHGCGTTKGM